MADVNISKYRASVVRDGSKPASPGFVVSEGQDPVNPPGTNNYVPYTGATANVELGEYGLESGFVTLDTTPTNTPTDQGTIYWDDTRSTAALIMNGTLQHIGQDSFFYVKNSSGSTIAKGTCVGFAGTDGGSGHLLVTPFLANGSVPSIYFMGVTCESIANGSFGQVMHFGELEGINTSGFTAGALLYASTTVAGGFQTTAPVAPNNIILVAAAVNSKNNGAIVVRPTLGSNINSDEGVKITSPTTGDLLQLQAGGLWENKTLAQVIGSAYVPSTRTLTINGTAFDLSANRSWTVGDVRTDGSYSNPSWITALAWSKITGTPTTLSGYGITDAVPSSRTITINGVTQDLSANRSFNVGTVTSVGLSSATSGVTIGSTPVTSSGTITLAIATASGSQQGLLSAADWTTFNNKQNALTNPVTGTGTTNYLAKFTGSTTVGNSILFESGSSIGIGTITPQIYTNYSVLEINNTTGGAIRVKNTASTGLFELATNSSETYIKNVSNTPMWFGTNNTQMLTLTTSGNLGLGVTPSAWSLSGLSAMQIQNAGFFGYFNETGITQNAYFNSGWKYIATGNATEYLQVSGEHRWYTAPSGTAGNAISFTQAMTLTSGGNLLVGTTSDNGERLQVNGEITAVTRIRINKTTQSNQIFGDGNAFNISGSNNLGIRNDSGSIVFASGGANVQLILNTSGNVGIGTTSPVSRLHVVGGSTTTGIANAATTVTSRIDLANPAITLGFGYVASDIPMIQSLNNGTNSATALSINPFGGNLLVGTTSDNGARLQVSGSATIGGNLTVSSGNNLNMVTGDIHFQSNAGYGILSQNGNRVIYFQNGLFGVTTQATFSSSVTANGTIRITRPADTSQYIDIYPSGGEGFIDAVNSLAGTIQPLIFRNGNSGGITERMRISSNGNVGIGTSSPSGRLTVSSDQSSNNQHINILGTQSGFSQEYTIGIPTSTKDLRIYDLTANVERMRITSSGNVGIGTSSPNRLLTVSGTTSGLIALNASSFRNTTIGSDSVGNFIVYDDTAGVYRMAINSSGNVLIGTTTDNGARLQVSGAVNITGEGTHIGIDASGGIGRIGFVKQSGAQPFMAFAADPLLIRVSNGSTIAATNTFSTVLTVATSGAATFSSSVTAGGTLTANTGTGATFRAIFGGTNVVEVGNYNATDGYRELLLSGSPISFYTSNAGASSVTERMRINSNGGVLLTSDAGNEQFIIRRASNTNAQLVFGYHSDGYGRIQAVEQNVAFRNLLLNQSGGNVLIGSASDNGARLQVNGTIRTANPTGSTSDGWLLGRALVSGTSTPDRWIRVQIGNLYYDILAVYMGSV